MARKASKRNRKAERGMTLIELMLAITMLAVGLIGVLALILAGIGGNSRNKLDTSGTMLAQMVMDKIVAQPALAGTPFDISDCNPAGAATWTIATAGAASPGNGATLDGATGAIDFSTAYAGIPDGYKMKFVSCGIQGQQITYEVRWNIQTVDAFSKMVTVGARPLGAQTTTGTMLRFFSRPVTLRTIVSS